MKHLIMWSVFLIGLVIMSFGISLMITAHLGSAPWDVLNIGLFYKFGQSIGTWSILVGLIILLSTTLFSRRVPGLGAVLNMLLVGIFIDQYLAMPWMRTPHSFFGQMAMLLIGIIINGVGISIYISANRGAGPRDTLMLFLTERTKWKLSSVRRTMEASVLIIGWCLGGPVSIGTLLYGLSIGSIVGWGLPISQYFVKKMVERGVWGENLNKRSVRVNHYDGTR